MQAHWTCEYSSQYNSLLNSTTACRSRSSPPSVACENTHRKGRVVNPPTEGAVYHGREASLPDSSYDFCVVGGGIYGLSTALLLKQRWPGKRVLVLEDNTIPGECITVNTGGIIRACYSDPNVMVVSQWSRRYYQSPREAMGLPFDLFAGFLPEGWIRAVNNRATPDILEEIERIASHAEKQGIPGVRVLPLKEYLARQSEQRRHNLNQVVDLEDITHVLEDENGGHTDGSAALEAFYTTCLHYGVDFSLNSTVMDFLKRSGRIVGCKFVRHVSPEEGKREIVAEETLSCDVTLIAAGLGGRKLVQIATGHEMPLYRSYHQTPYIRNTPDTDFRQTAHERMETVEHEGGERVRQTSFSHTDIPALSHWRNFYFTSEGEGVTVGAHHRELHTDDYEPEGGVLRTDSGEVRVGVIQSLFDMFLENSDHFPIFDKSGLDLGNSPRDVPGGSYIMNPEELPFEGEVPGTGGTLFFAGSGSGTGFKLAPGVAKLLVDRIAGVRLDERIISSPALSAERSEYFYKPGTTDEELRRLFRSPEEGGRFYHVGAAGILVRAENTSSGHSS